MNGNRLCILFGTAAFVFLILSCGKSSDANKAQSSTAPVSNCTSLQAKVKAVTTACGVSTASANHPLLTQYAGTACATALKQVSPSQCAGLQERISAVTNACATVFRRYASLIPRGCRTALETYTNVSSSTGSSSGTFDSGGY